MVCIRNNPFYCLVANIYGLFHSQYLIGLYIIYIFCFFFVLANDATFSMCRCIENGKRRGRWEVQQPRSLAVNHIMCIHTHTQCDQRSLIPKQKYKIKIMLVWTLNRFASPKITPSWLAFLAGLWVVIIIILFVQMKTKFLLLSN